LKSSTYRPDIDGLRALAIIPVVLFHAFPEIFPGGFIGVDIFFVISGFLISSIILDGVSNQNFSFKDFYTKRIKRIFPALILVLLCTLVIAWFTLLSDDFQSLGNHTWRGAIFISNFLLWRESGYFDTAAETKPLLHLWSLSIEEQFYLFWPVAIWLLWKLRKTWILKAIVLIFISSFLCNIFLIQKESIAVFYNPLTRFWELLLGAFLAYRLSLQSDSFKLRLISPTALSIIGFALIVAGLALLNKSRQFPGWWALMPTLGAFLLILSGPEAWVNRNILSKKFLVWIGLISFPLYLWHWPLFSFARIFYGPHPPEFLLGGLIVISIVLAWGTYQLIERPIRHRINPIIGPIKLALGLIAVGLMGLAIFKLNGVSSRFPQIEKDIASLQWSPSENNTETCKAKYPSEQYCVLSDESNKPTAAIIGDSHANHFFKGLSEFYKSRHGNLINLGYGACGPFMGLDRAEVGPNGYLNCYKKMQPIFEYVLKDKDIKTVFLAYHHNEYALPTAKLVDFSGKLDSSSEQALLTDSLVKTVNALSASGKEVVLIYDLPNLTINTGTHIKQCFYANLLKINTGCSEKNIQFQDNFTKYDETIDRLRKETAIKVFDTREFVNGNFPINGNQEWTYRDYQHLTTKGSLFFADKYKW
jgi:peptidoglycan/LPS O-acetylase OafA/YrhL